MNVVAINKKTNKKQPAPADLYAGTQLKIARKQARMSQTTLGAQLDLTFQQIQKYENGYNRMSASVIAQISTILGVPPSFFFKEDISDKGAQIQQLNILAELASNTDALELNTHFCNVKDPKLRKQIIRLVQAIAAS